MKKLILIALTLLVSLSAYPQANQATQEAANNVVKNNPLTSGRVYSALNAITKGKPNYIGAFLASGTDTYTVSIAMVTAYTTHLSLDVRFPNTNTGASTIDITSLGAIPLVKNVSTALVAGDLQAGKYYRLYYDGTNFQVSGIGFSLSNGSGTTASGNGVNWGGAVTTPTTLTMGSNALLISGDNTVGISADIVEFSTNTGAGATYFSLGNQSFTLDDQVGNIFNITADASGLMLKSPASGNFNMLFGSSGIVVTDNRGTKEGIEYAAANYVTQDRSLTDRGYVLGAKTYTGTQTFAGTSFPTAPTLSDGVKWVFNPNSSTAGINVGAQSGAVSTPANGDIWYNSSANTLTARINGANVDLGAGGGGSGTVTSV